MLSTLVSVPCAHARQFYPRLTVLDSACLRLLPVRYLIGFPLDHMLPIIEVIFPIIRHQILINIFCLN